MTRRDEAALLAIEIIQYSEASLTSVVVTGKVCRIYYVSKNIESLHSWSLNSNLFTMNRETESHNPNLLLWRRWRPSIGESPLTSEEIASSASCPFWRHISALPLVRRCAWSPERNLTQPRKAATRSPVIRQNAYQFTSDLRV